MRNTCFILFIILTVSNVQAQQTSSPSKANPWGWGIFAGVNYSYPVVRVQYPTQFSPQANLLLGADVRYQFDKRSSLHIQPSWVRVSNVKPTGNFFPEFSLGILKIPIQYRAYMLSSRKILFLEAGASYNRIIQSSYREQAAINCEGPNPVCPVLYGPEISPSTKSAVSAMAGLGVDLPVKHVTIPVTLRYERYVSSYLFPANYPSQPNKSVGFETVSLITGISF